MIRIAVEADLPAILAIYAPYVENTTYSFEYTVPTEASFLQRFRKITAQCPYLVWEEDGQVLGYAYGSLPFTRAAYAWMGEVSIYLAPEIQGRGIGRKMYAAIEEIMALQGYRVLYAVVTEENRGSVAFHQALGYKIAGQFSKCGFKFDRWVGVTWLEKHLDFVKNPSETPVSWKNIVENNENLQNILDKLALS